MRHDKNFLLFVGAGLLSSLLLITCLGFTGVVSSTYAQELGELILEQNGKITDQKEVSPNKVQVSYSTNGTLKGNIEVKNNGNFEGITKGGVTHAHGQGTITTKDGNETASYTFLGVGKVIDGGNKSEFRGATVYNTTSTEKLAFVNNLVSVFKVNMGETGNITAKEWEWK